MCPTRSRRPGRTGYRLPAFDYHVTSYQREITPEEMATFEAEGWVLFSVNPPVGPEDSRWTYNFRRRPQPPVRRRGS